MAEVALNWCAVLVLLAIALKSAVSSDADIAYQVGELNNKLSNLQDRLNLFDAITEGNVSVLVHRVEFKDLTENVTVHMNETNRKLANLEDKIDTRLIDLESKLNALAATVTNFVGNIERTLLKPLSSCADAFARPLFNRGSGVYNIQPIANLPPFKAYCMADPKGGEPWTVVQRRVDDTVDFYRNWTEYKRGFGDLAGNHWIGLDKLHLLTTKGEPQELWVMLTNSYDISAHAYHDRFAIGNEAEKYPLEVLGEYSGDAGDSFKHHKSMKFSTYDNDNDHDNRNCAKVYKSAWWFDDCYYCHLNGVYDDSGMYWYPFRENPVKYAHMAIRPARK